MIKVEAKPKPLFYLGKEYLTYKEYRQRVTKSAKLTAFMKFIYDLNRGDFR